MQSYSIDYEVKGVKHWGVSVEAKDIKSARKKLGRKHGYKTGRMIKIIKSSVIGYF